MTRLADRNKTRRIKVLKKMGYRWLRGTEWGPSILWKVYPKLAFNSILLEFSNAKRE